MFGFPRRSGTQDFRARHRLYNLVPPRQDLLSVWLRADLGCFQQADGTGVAAAGLPVRWVTDLSGNSRHCKSSGAGATLVDVDGLAIDNVSGTLPCDAPAFALQDIFVVMRAPTPTFAGYGVAFGSTSRSWFFESGQAQLHYNPYPTSASRNGVALSAPFPLAPMTEYFLLRVTPYSPQTSYSWVLGGDGSYLTRVYIKEVLGYANGLTDAERAIVTNILKLRHHIA